MSQRIEDQRVESAFEIGANLQKNKKIFDLEGAIF